MKKRYIIKELIYNGYWDSEYRSFKGIVFASQYLSKQDAINVINAELKPGRYEIIKIYIK